MQWLKTYRITLQSRRSERAKCKAPEPVNRALAREVAATALRRDSMKFAIDIRCSHAGASGYKPIVLRCSHAGAQWPTHPKHGGFGSFTQSTFCRLDTSYFVQSSSSDGHLVHRVALLSNFIRSSSPKVDLRPLVALKGNYVQSGMICHSRELKTHGRDVT
ncbi:hypothetical protein [Membranihabitans marinus]|uniref:hypothetical protein n=1 Tax=Membranihabitans marinus TaxID=1227546 RepID=UPI001F1B2FE5|nr:hypothetical protein [Membranihabitans marinus]